MSFNTKSWDEMREDLDRINKSTFPTDDARKEFLNTAISLCHRLERPMENLLRVSWVEPAHTACLKIAMDVGLFAALGECNSGETYSAEELAKATKTDRNLLGKSERDYPLPSIQMLTFCRAHLATPCEYEHNP